MVPQHEVWQFGTNFDLLILSAARAILQYHHIHYCSIIAYLVCSPISPFPAVRSAPSVDYYYSPASLSSYSSTTVPARSTPHHYRFYPHHHLSQSLHSNSNNYHLVAHQRHCCRVFRRGAWRCWGFRNVLWWGSRIACMLARRSR